MEFVDDRTKEQKQTHTCIILSTDTVLSGWGTANKQDSYSGWACKPEHKNKIFNWVESRTDTKNVREVRTDYRPSSKNVGHCHIYVISDDHPALR